MWSVVEQVAGIWHVLYLLFLPAFVVWVGFYRHKRHRLWQLAKAIPGPRALPLLGNALEFKGDTKAIFKHTVFLAQKYGDVFALWFGPKLHIMITSSSPLESFLGSSAVIDKAEEYAFLSCWLGTGLLTGSGPKWHKNRKIITPTFHAKILEGFVDIFNRNTEIFVRNLERIGSDDITPRVALCTLDIICEAAMGISIQAQEDSDSDYVRAVHRVCEIFHHRHFKAWLRSDIIFRYSSYGKELVKQVKILQDVSTKVIEERKKQLIASKQQSHSDAKKKEDIGEKKRLAFLDLLLEASSTGGRLTDEEIKEEVNTFMFAGHDTTAVAISFALYLLGAHPEIQEKAVRELEEIFGDSRRSPSMADLLEMKYLERCIKESLRLFPSVPFISRQVNKEVKIGDYLYPAGSSATVFIYMVHRDPKIYSNPEKFDPDNFLPEKTEGRLPYSYIPFSGGPRNCIGQKFAMLVEKAVISGVLRRFRLESVNKMEDLGLKAEIVLKADLKVKFHPRVKP